MAPSLCKASDRWPLRRAALRRVAQDRRRRDRSHDPQDAGGAPERCDALEPEDHGQEDWPSPSTVHSIAFGLQPHRVESFKLSSDPLFVEKVRDIVGLYLSPPEHVIVLCVDENSQVQALDRTQPLLPMRPGQAERRTHDYKRNGTTSLFAALDVKAGTIVGKCMARHRATEFRKFLDEVERNVPTDLDVHVVMDNSGTDKTKLNRHWFAKRPRWHVHFTPTSALWINQVECFFALSTERALKRGVFSSVADLEKRPDSGNSSADSDDGFNGVEPRTAGLIRSMGFNLLGAPIGSFMILASAVERGNCFPPRLRQFDARRHRRFERIENDILEF